MNKTTSWTEIEFSGFVRPDGRKGIRNYVVVAYSVYCAQHVARLIAAPYRFEGVQLIGFDQCYPSDYGFHLMKSLCTHPNTGAVLLVSLGCEEFRRSELKEAVAASDRPVELLVIQEAGGTLKTMEKGRRWVEESLRHRNRTQQTPMTVADLTVGLECGGSDGFSGITANPAVGLFTDQVIDAGGTVIFEETNELYGCEKHLAGRARTPEIGVEVVDRIDKAVSHYRRLGHASFGGGNISGGLSTIEEKSAGAYAKTGHKPLDGVLIPGTPPPRSGLYLLDTVYDGDFGYGIPNIHDTHSVTALTASGCHLIVFTTGRGSVVGQAISPVIKICSNTYQYKRLIEDMDVNAGRIADGRAELHDVAGAVGEAVVNAAGGAPSKSEMLGHQECYVSDGRFAPLPRGASPCGR